MTSNQCETHRELLLQAQGILEKIKEIVDRQKQVIGSEGVSNYFLVHDKEVELLMGEKERVVGALRQHDEEHGCQNSSVLWNPNEPASN